MNSQLQTKFLRKHGVIAVLITVALGSIPAVSSFRAWMRHQPAEGSVATMIIFAVFAGLMGLFYWLQARRAARDLDELVPLKPSEVLADWQKVSLQSVTRRVRFLFVGAFVFTGFLVFILMLLHIPYGAGIGILFVSLDCIAVVVSFAYRQGLRDGRKSSPDSPAKDETK